MVVLPIRAFARAVVTHGRDALRGRDLTLWAAGLSFFAIIAVVPMLLLALRGAAVLFGDDLVLDATRWLGAALPDAHDVTPALESLAHAALDASWLMLATALVSASLYGEGLRRALKQVAGSPVTGLTGWQGRFGFLPVLAASPLLIALPLALTPAVSTQYQAGGWSTVFGVVLSFHIDWVVVSTAVGLVFAFTGPAVLPVGPALLAGFAVGAVVTGFLHGFVVFLAIPVDWNVPFGGLPVAGAVVALALWLLLLHVVLLVGYRMTLSFRAVSGKGSRGRGLQDGTVRSDSRPVAR